MLSVYFLFCFFLFSFLPFFCFVFSSVLGRGLFCIVLKRERERTWSWEGKGIGRILEELGEEKNLIKIYCMSQNFNKKKRKGKKGVSFLQQYFLKFGIPKKRFTHAFASQIGSMMVSLLYDMKHLFLMQSFFLSI